MPIDLIEHYPHGQRTLEFMEPSLKEMGHVMDQYVDYGLVRNPIADMPFSYTERATLSQFVGGIWRSNPSNLVLEEYASEKACPGGKYKGRKDIWFSIDGTDCYAEAKQAWGNVPGWLHGNIGACLDLMRSECEKAFENSKDERAQGTVRHALGIVFILVTLFRDDLERSAEHFDSFRAELGRAVGEFTFAQPYDVLRASFLRSDIFICERFYEAQHKNRKRWQTHPGLETLICVHR